MVTCVTSAPAFRAFSCIHTTLWPRVRASLCFKRTSLKKNPSHRLSFSFFNTFHLLLTLSLQTPLVVAQVQEDLETRDCLSIEMFPIATYVAS